MSVELQCLAILTYNWFYILLCRIGFVTQDDVLFTHLTVKETLTYAALLRLPRTMTREQKKERAMDIIYELGLERYMLHILSLVYMHIALLFSQGSLVNRVSMFEGARTL